MNNKFWRVLSGIIGAVFGAFAGLVIRLLAFPLSFDSVASLALQVGPWMLGFALVFGYMFYRWTALAELFLYFFAGEK